MTQRGRKRSNKSGICRRRFLKLAVALGATAAWGARTGRQSPLVLEEMRELFPEGVASGDPDASSVLLWTRYLGSSQTAEVLFVEISEDDAFSRVIAFVKTTVSSESDGTSRVLVGNLQPSKNYWYRFSDEKGRSSRVGRTRTAPDTKDFRQVRFAFVCCQNVNLGSQHAYRKMMQEDLRAPLDEQLEFVLHLGDFVYEVVWYPEDRPQGVSGRRPRDVLRYAHGEKIGDLHVPSTLEDYRSLYRTYLHDQDIQDARARWPFVCIWDNHEFSINGWQSVQVFNGQNRAAQTRKVAANQAWFEYQPARVIKSSGPRLDVFDPPLVRDTAITRFDRDGLGNDANNLAALASLTGYRALHWGGNVELILTDQRSYRSEDPLQRPEVTGLMSADFPNMVAEEALEILDAGDTYGGGAPPSVIRFGSHEIENFRKAEAPQTMLGAVQKKWFLEHLKKSAATWKVWGNTIGTVDGRADPQNLPTEGVPLWPGASYATIQTGDYATAYRERAEIYAVVRDFGITGFVTLCGNSHSFWAALAAPYLPPRSFEPIGVAFVTAAISSPGDIEALESRLPSNHPLRTLYLRQGDAGARPEPTLNLLQLHGVRSCLEYAKTGDLQRAKSLSNSDLAPHLRFLDLDGHGYSTVRASHDAFECEFVCIPRPSEDVMEPDGGQVLYRVSHRVPLWTHGQRPSLEQKVLEGNPVLSL